MTNKKLARDGLLRSLLAALVDEWGHQAVRDRLDEFRGMGGEHAVAALAQEGRRGKPESGHQALEKPTASSLAAKVSLPPGQKQLIEQLAIQYDGKRFLPTSGDIRYFFEVHGEEPPTAKQRSETFRRVLRLLSTMPESALRKMIDDDAHSGPSRLGPLSEAMRSVGEQRSVGRSLGLAPPHEASDAADSNRQVGTDLPSGA